MDRVAPDAVYGADDEGDDGGLESEEEGRDGGGPEAEGEAGPAEAEHEEEPRQHEAEPRDDGAGAAPGEHPEPDAELVGLGPGEDLVDGQGAMEALDGHPPLLLDELLLEHRDLRHGPAPGEGPEAEEPQEEGGEGVVGDGGPVGSPRPRSGGALRPVHPASSHASSAAGAWTS